MQILETNHRDAILAVQFNWFGNKMATASIDQSVKIWAKDENDK
jgi:WD40 repeat protein